MQVVIVSEVELNKGRLSLSYEGHFLNHKIKIIYIVGKSISLNKGDVVIIKGWASHVCGKTLFIVPQKMKILFEGIK